MKWKITPTFKEELKLKNPVLIEGLPGIGNVGKIAADFIIEELDGKKVFDVFSYSMPHSVFVNEDNLVELPKIEIFHVKAKKNDILIISGDMQPIDEESSYEFSDQILDLCMKLKIKEVITLGGVGLQEMPIKPKVYCTGNNHDTIKKYSDKTKMKTKVYGIIGPIMGVSGLLVGLADKKNIGAISILAETLGHPMFLGIKGAKEMLKNLDKKFEFGIKISKLNKEIKALEKEMRMTEEISQSGDKTEGKHRQVNYIG